MGGHFKSRTIYEKFMNQPSTPTTQGSSPLAQVFKALAAVEPYEVRAVVLSMLYFLFPFGSYSVVKPVRDALLSQSSTPRLGAARSHLLEPVSTVSADTVCGQPKALW
jgi:hypothetical protein